MASPSQGCLDWISKAIVDDAKRCFVLDRSSLSRATPAIVTEEDNHARNLLCAGSSGSLAAEPRSIRARVRSFLPAGSGTSKAGLVLTRDRRTVETQRSIQAPGLSTTKADRDRNCAGWWFLVGFSVFSPLLFLDLLPAGISETGRRVRQEVWLTYLCAAQRTSQASTAK
jgi:hypothetical protein